MIRLRIIALLIGLFCTSGLFAQDEVWLSLRAKQANINLNFDQGPTGLEYLGNDVKLKAALQGATIYDFKRTYRSEDPNWADRMYFVRTNDAKLMDRLLATAGHLFVWGHSWTEDEMKIFEPNDYGLSSTIGANLGMQADLSYLDFLGVPKAWYYTTGDPDLVIGISDALVDTTDVDFKGKTRIMHRSSSSNGHGISTAANAAAQGDNAHGIPGVCYDCGIYGTSYGDFKSFRNVSDLSATGVNVINCSWSSTKQYESGRKILDSLFDNGTIVIAAAGNKSWQVTKGEQIYYPAGFDNVISVAAVMYKYPDTKGNIGVDHKGNYYANDIRGYVGRSLGFKNNDTLVPPHIWPISTSNLNDQVDILAPAVGLVSYGKKVLKDTLYYSRFQTTSGATPLVSGTVGLMRSLYPCLPVQEIEPLLKVTAINIDHLPGNQRFSGKYGAGMLQTGAAVEMVYKLYNPNEVATISGQRFNRWHFPLRAVSKQVVMEDQHFTEAASLSLNARKQIVLKPGTFLSPGRSGKVHLSIDPTLEQECDLQLRDPSILEN